MEDPGSFSAGLADIPLVKASDGSSVLIVSIPAGVGLTSKAVRSDRLSLHQQLVDASASYLGDEPNSSATIQASIDQYIPTLVPDSQLTIRTVTLNVASGITTPSTSPIVVTGTNGATVSDGDIADQQEALIIDARNLPSGSVLQLDKVEFAVLIGAVRVVGGEGGNFVTGDSAVQFIVLGVGDDILHGGGGNDVVGSKLGNDQLFGDDGDDLLVGGADNDILEGGTGNDVLQGDQSDAGQWAFTLSADGKLVSDYTANEAVLTNVAKFTHIGAWDAAAGIAHSDDRLAFSTQSTERLKTVALLHQAVADRLPTLAEFNHYTALPMSEHDLAGAALNYYVATHAGIATASLETQVRTLVETVWGGTASDEIVAIGVRYLTNGGNWADGLLKLAQHDLGIARITGADGSLNLTQIFANNESGWHEGTGSDILRGGDGNDRLVGGGGNDYLDGGTGNDVAVFIGSVKNFTVSKSVVSGTEQLVLTNLLNGEKDTLVNVEYLQIGSKFYGYSSALTALAVGQEVALVGVVTSVSTDQVLAQGVNLSA